MRLKNVPGSQEAIAASPWAVTEPEALRGRWRSLFGSDGPLVAEIGMGKGRFLLETAARSPQTLFLGLEKYSSVLLRAVQKQEQAQLPNLMLVRADAQFLEDMFAPDELDRIYLNFSDPWPKDRHADRRLTSVRFLRRYEHVLAPDGTVAFKTDNEALFDFSLASADEAGWELLEMTRDLHHSEQAAGNVMTEYEEKFSAAGQPIFRMVIRRPERQHLTG